MIYTTADIRFSAELFDAQIERFEEAWLDETRSGPPPRIEVHLPPAQMPTEPGFGRRELLIELVMIDLECRWREVSAERRGLVLGGVLPKRPTLEDYVQAYPDLGKLVSLPIELIAQEYQARKRWGDQPSHDEYLDRFPQHRDELHELLCETDSSIDERTSPFCCPNCRSPIIITDEAQLAETVCASCGKSFSPLAHLFQDSHDFSLQPFAQFEQLRKIGQGAFGSVYRAWDRKLERWVALKFPRRFPSHEECERIADEGKAAARLDHPNIVKIHDVKSYQADGQDDILYIVSDYIEGQSFEEWLIHQHPSPEEAAQLCQTIARALHHAHERDVIHRDVKPSNLLLDTDNVPFVTDFGLARCADGDGPLASDGHVVGAPAYMSPEQAQGKGNEADRRSDVYSLGVVFYEMLTGERPFREGNVERVLDQVTYDEPPRPRSRNSRIPRDLETICLKCLKKVPSERYATTCQLADDLGRFLHGEPIKARPVSVAEKAVKWIKRRPVAAMLVVVTILAVLSVGRLLAIQAEIHQDQIKGFEEKLSRLTDALDRGDLKSAQQLSDEFSEAAPESKLDQKLKAAKRQLRTMARHRNVERLYIDALFRASQPPSIAPDDTLQLALQNSRDALKEAGLYETTNVPLLDSPYLDTLNLTVEAEHKLRTTCYELFLLLAESLAKKAQFNEALDCLDGLSDKVEDGTLPEHTKAYYLQRAQYCDNINRAQEAVELRKQAERMSASSPLDHFLLGRHELTKQSYEAAQSYFVAASDSGHFWAKYYLAISHLRDKRGNKDEARANLLECANEEGLLWLQIMAGFACGLTDDYKRAQQYFAFAEKLIEEEPDVGQANTGRFVLWVHQAAVFVETANSVNSDRRQTLLESAASYLDKAIDLACRQLDSFGHSLALAYLNRAVVAARLNNDEDARKWFQKAIATHDNSPTVFRRQAEYLLLAANHRTNDRTQINELLRDAKNSFEKAAHLESRPMSKADDFREVGRVLEDLDQPDQSKTAFDEALEQYKRAIDETDDPLVKAQARGKRARIFLGQGRYDQARNECDSALQLNPHQRNALLDRVQINIKQERWQSALADLNAYIDNADGPVNFEVYRDQAYVFYRLEEFTQTIEACGQALQAIRASVRIENRAKSISDMRFLRGIVLAHIGSPKLAEQEFTAVVQHGFPDNTNGALLARAAVRVQQDKFDEGISDYNLALSGITNNTNTPKRNVAEAYLARGYAYLLRAESQIDINRDIGGYEIPKGPIGNATRDLQTAINLGPKTVVAEAFYLKGQTNQLAKRFGDAIKDYSHAIKQNPNRLELYYHRAWCRYRKWHRWTRIPKRQYEQAFEAYINAIKDANRIVNGCLDKSVSNSADRKSKLIVHAAAIYAQPFKKPEWGWTNTDWEWSQEIDENHAWVAENQVYAQKLLKWAVQVHANNDPTRRESYVRSLWQDLRFKPLRENLRRLRRGRGPSR